MTRMVRIAFSLLTVLALVHPAGAVESKLDINKASAEDFIKLPKIGPAVAQRIVEHRKLSGGFRRLEDLMAVRGIGQKTFDSLKDQLSVGDGAKGAPVRPAEQSDARAGGAR